MSVMKLAVRELVEFILRSGSIDEGKNSNHTALEGAKIHRKLQKQATEENYQKEVWLTKVVTLAGTSLQIEGRADGIFEAEGQVVIDEIKTSETPFEEVESGQIELFFYQAMVYAYLYAEVEQLSQIATRLTYFQTVEEKITRQTRSFTFEELTEFWEDLLAKYESWFVYQKEWQATRNASLQALPFPFSYRKGQRELAAAVYKTIHAQQKLFVEAPTGIGKTMSTLFPSFKALGEGLGERIFYLTAKTITRQVAENSITTLAEREARVKSVTLTAKDKICFLTERNCTPEHCPFAAGYYDRVNDGLWEMLQTEDQYTRPVIEKYAQKHMLCPFELSLDISRFCDVVIGDYNYLFDPTVYLRRFFETPNEENLVLVDEAHNLVNRAREMYSATISRNHLADLEVKVAAKFRKLKKAFRRVDDEFELIAQMAQEQDWTYHAQPSPADSLTQRLFQLQEVMKEWLAENPQQDGQEKMLAAYFEINRFTRMSEFYDDHYLTTVDLANYDLVVKEFCVDPAYFLEQTTEKVGSSIFFSASFSPLAYYQEVLGGGEDSLTYRLPSPFPTAKQLILIDSAIQTIYRKRTENIPAIIEAIAALIHSKQGNYFVFFPSFAFLDQVVEAFQAAYPNINVQIQGSHLTETEREHFLAAFQAEPTETLVGFCVLGGIFSEGIDLVGDRLIGAVIVGVGLPQMNHEQELIKDYFDAKNHQGFAYAYQLPGMNKVIQASGRVIRSMEDRGVVLLLDQRYLNPTYQKLLPLHWQNIRQVTSSQQIEQQTLEFWQNESNE